MNSQFLTTLSLLSLLCAAVSGLKTFPHHHHHHHHHCYHHHHHHHNHHHHQLFDRRSSNHGMMMMPIQKIGRHDHARKASVAMVSMMLARTATTSSSSSSPLLQQRSSSILLWNTASSSSSLSSSSSSSEFDVSEDELEETVLRINFSYPSSSSSSSSDDDKGSLALTSVQKYTNSFPFAAVLPVQPLTYLPVKMSNGNPALKVTFLRKKTAEKGSMDGGMLFTSRLVSEEDYDDTDNGNDDNDSNDDDTLLDNSNNNNHSNYKKGIELTARRITKGQTVSKVFSEKLMITAFVKGLSEERGRDVLAEGGGVEVDSVFHPWM